MMLCIVVKHGFLQVPFNTGKKKLIFRPKSISIFLGNMHAEQFKDGIPSYIDSTDEDK